MTLSVLCQSKLHTLNCGELQLAELTVRVQMLIAFRGTQPTKHKDIITNLDFRPTHLRLPSRQQSIHTAGSDSASTASPAGSAASCAGCCQHEAAQLPAVHRGFYKSVQSVLPRIKALLDICSGGDGTWGVCICGHSLGASLATVCAYALATRRECASCWRMMRFAWLFGCQLGLMLWLHHAPCCTA